MKVDLLVAEIGSTTTIINAFNGIADSKPVFLGSGFAPTSVIEGNVLIGLRAALYELEKLLGDKIVYDKMLATSSAAGGLKMTVHGLVYDMTARAAKEAALGAGAIIRHMTAGKLSSYDIADIEQIKPNLILLAGGTDYGEKETAIFNANMLTKISNPPPVVFVGNIQCRREIEDIFTRSGLRYYITENVYPRLDELNVEPARKIIHEVFTKHITQAPGMEHVREMVDGDIIPTPGAVMECARLLYERIGDCLVLDVGGATTDVHSATAGSDEISSISISPEPLYKRTVEGDLGVFVNAENVIEMIGSEKLSQRLGFDVFEVLKGLHAIPETDKEAELVAELAFEAAKSAILRHVGRLRDVFGANGRKRYAEGKDLTKVKYLVATGGALTRLRQRESIMEKLVRLNYDGRLLYPKAEHLKVLYDRQYIMASIGAMSKEYPDAAEILLRRSLCILD